MQLLNVGGKSRRQLASILSVIASSFFLLFFNYSFSTFLELNHIQFSLQLISIMLEYFEWGFCMCSLLWRNEKGKGKLKTETIVLVWFFCEEKNQSRSNPSNLLNRRFCPVSPISRFVFRFYDITVFRPFRTGHGSGSRLDLLNWPDQSDFN